MGFAGNLFNIPYIAYIQSTVPPESMGKVLSLVSSGMCLATPIGLFVAGPAAEVIGIDRWFLLSGCLIVLIGFYCAMITKKFDDSQKPLDPDVAS